ncbi:hypothetical protein VB264_05275 [Arcicella aquatica]|uniref:Uncharacterized protein n=1 Tax=Arcicella aquatica TaxID=217141 RepID=A0ABU5QJF0_9BACT|nr:hypothetical protein [Arcicella aquatica]MEA5257188.1 hypothetical protein [Arcicella aquatica]
MSGYYKPNCFELKIDTFSDIDIAKSIKDPNDCTYTSTFIHEYVHFLQSLTTTTGLYHFFLDMKEFIHYKTLMYKTDGYIFPNQIKLNNDYNLLANREIIVATYGDNQIKIENSKFINYTHSELTIKSNDVTPDVKLNKYEVNLFDDIKSEKIKVHFGTFHLKEYMAYAIQRKGFPETLLDEVPYKLVELIIKSIYPNFDNVDYIIALCDASLMYDNPAKLFLESIERMKKENWLPQNIDDIYEFSYFSIGGSEVIIDYYEMVLQNTSLSFKGIFDGEYFQNNVKWFEYILSQAEKLRKLNRGFFSELTESTDKIYTKTFIKILNTIGTPFMLNNNFNGSMVLPDEINYDVKPFYPSAVFSILRNLRSPHNYGCALKNFCDASGIETNDNCINSPWLRIKDDMICSYGHILALHGLKEFIK